MTRAIDVQFFGAALVVGAFAASEGAARFLETDPSSPLAWYLAVSVFGVFEAGRTAGSPLSPLFGPLALEVSLALLLALVGLRAVRFRLGLALAANLSFVATLFLLSAAMRSGMADARWVSLGAMSIVPMSIVSTRDAAALTALLASSFAASAASHLVFLRAVAGERRRRAAPTRAGDPSA